MQIKSAVFTAVVLWLQVTLSQAASVDIAASGSDAWNKTLVGTYVKNTKFIFLIQVKYTINP